MLVLVVTIVIWVLLLSVMVWCVMVDLTIDRVVMVCGWLVATLWIPLRLLAVCVVHLSDFFVLF